MFKKLLAADFPKLYNVLAEETATEAALHEMGTEFFCALYGLSNSMSMNAARYAIYSMNKSKPPQIKALPPTDENLCYHMLRAHP